MITIDFTNAAQCAVVFFFVLIFSGFFYFCGFCAKEEGSGWPILAGILMLVNFLMLIVAIFHVIISNL